MDVTVFLEPKVDIEKLAEVLDGLGHEGRVHATRTWTKKQMAAIYDACAGRPISLDFLVPSSVGANTEVIHDLRNTLPLFSNAQKRFARGEGEGTDLVGFNKQHGLAAVSEPGYFMVRAGEGEHENELVIDYGQTPKSKPDVWPEIEPNDSGILNGLVWGGMVDYLRKISEHVSIGKATKKGKAIGQYFALVRRDAT